MSHRRRAGHVNGGRAPKDMAASRLPGIPLWSLWLLLPLVIVNADLTTVEPIVLLDDSTKVHTAPLLLGERPYECVGNPNLCPDGFSVSFTFRPAAPRYDVPAEYLVSTGGQSRTSTGYYVRRNYGLEYEVGVAKGTKLWTVPFDVNAETGQDVTVLLTWNEGLDVYVDGFPVGADVTGRARVFTAPAFDPLRNIVVGGAEDNLMAPGTSRQLALHGLKHWDTFYWQQDISGVVPAESFRKGCVTTPPSTSDVPQDVVVSEDSTETAADKCRYICFGNGKQLALLSPENKCLCHSPEDLGAYLTTASDQAPCWSVFLVTSFMVKTYPINLAHTVVLPTDKGYTRPNESIVFKLTTNTPEEVLFRLNYGDGTTTVTADTTVSHFYTQDGTYVVNITAQTRSTVETQLETVKIEWVDEGVAPNVVKVQASTGPNPREIVVDAVAISPQKMDCILNLGDGNMENYNDLTDLVHTKRVAHTYETVGLYDVSMACTNKDGTTQSSVITPSVNKTMDYETKTLGMNVVVPFYGADTHHSIVDVQVNHLSLGGNRATLGGADVTLPGGEFSHSGEYLLQLKSENAVLRQRVVNLQREIVSTAIDANVVHTEKDMAIQFVFKIFGGDHVHVLIEYGDGEEELLYVPLSSDNGPVMIHRNHTYTALGKYTVSLTVANDVSTSVATQLMSIERPIYDAKATVQNVTFLGDPAEFMFEVDSGVLPAMPIRVDFDFGNGESGSGEIGELRNDGTPAVFRYTYPKYGIYYPIVTISNNLSSLVLQFPSLQVGENITHVDMVTSTDVVQLDEEFEIVIDCPKGQPILYEVSIGDGTVIKLSVPVDYTSEHDMIADIDNNVAGTTETTTPYTYHTTEEMGVVVTGNSTEVRLSRRKREADQETASVTTVVVPTQNDAFEAMTAFGESGNTTDAAGTNMTTTAMPTTTTTMQTTTTVAPTRPPNDKITVRYKFKEAGQYLIQVKTSNSFGHRETWSCPMLRAVSRANPLACEGMKVTTDVATSQETPLVAHRSEEVRVGLSVDLSCSGLTSTPEYDYTWSTEGRTLHTQDGMRPELGVCHSAAKDPSLVIPGNTLWYGDYTIQAKVRLVVSTQTGRVRRAVAEDVTVVTPDTPAPTAEDWKVRQNLEAAKAVIAANIARQLREFSDAVEVPPASMPLNLDGKELTTLTASVNLYLQVTKTPLVATLKGADREDVPKFDVINLNAEESHDPDVALKMNRTGMHAHIFCHPGAQSEEWKRKTLEQKIAESTKLANNTYDNCAIYDHGCFEKTDRVWVLGWEAVFLADNLYKNDTMHFDLVVTKDGRTASFEKVIRVLFSNATGVDMLNNIDALLASGDTNAALLVIDLVSGLLDGPSAGAADNQTEAKKAKTEVRGKLIGALEKVSGALQNYDQTSKTLGVLNSVTGVPDEVTTDSKVGAAGALGNAGAACKETTDDVPIDKVTDTAGGLINCAGNVLPFDEDQMGGEEGMTTEEPQIVITTTSSSYVPGQGQVTSTTTVVTTPTTKTVTTSSPLGVSVTTTPMTPTVTPSTTPDTLGNITVMVDGVGEMTLSQDGWTTTAPLPTTTTTTPAPTTTTTTTTAPTTTTRRTTTTPSDEDVPGFMTTALPGEEAEPTEEPVIPCCQRVPEGGLCDWIEPKCEYLDEDDRKKHIWTDKVCDEVHPDDLEVFVKRFRLFKDMQKRILFLKRKSTTTNAMSAVSDVADVVTGKSASNTSTKIETPKMKVEMGKMDASANGSSNGINFPGSALNGSSGDVGSLSMVSPNPFTYSDSAKDIKSDVKSLSFKDANGTELVVQDSEPIDIWIEGQPHLVPAPKLSFIEHNKDTTSMNFHNIILPSNESSIHVIIRPDDPDDEFEIYIKYLDFPNETYFDHRGYIPNTEVDQWEASDEDKDDLRYTYFPDQSVTALNGSYKIGVKLIKSVVNYKASATDKKNSTYRFRVFTSGCRFWNKENDTWDTAGCWVGNLTTIRMTQCQCTHLTSFGGDFVVPPNTIDFSTVFSAEKFLEAVPVFVTVALVLLLYVAALVWARRADKKDVLKWGASPLEDNLPSDSYHYQITVNTGVKKNASTTSRISFILSGDTGDTGVRRLSDGKRKEHPSGSIYNYVLSVEQTLGPLTYLRIWHDNTGSGKKRSWFLGQVQINDLQTGEKFFFLCDRWLAVEEDDGMVERILPVAGMNDLTAFKHLFNSSVRKKLTNDHLWVSIMSRPTRSNFTRVQRLSCCVSLLFLTMITNCMFFKADDKVENVSVLRVGPLTFTLHQLFISVVTTLIVFPPSMIIVIIFRKARAKKNAIQHMNQQMSKKSKRFKWRTFNPGSNYWTVERTRAQKFKDTMRNILSSSNHSKYEETQDVRPLNKKKKKRFSLPHWTVYFAWMLVTLSILGSGFFTVLYSMEWGREKSLEWLSTFLLSFFQSVAVVQPIKVLLLAAFISCVLRKPDIDDEEGDFDENNGPDVGDQTVLNRSQKDLQALMMQRKMANESLQPPDTEALEASRKLRLQELQMEAVLKECIIYLFFLLVLFFLSYQARDSDSFMYAENIKNTFVHNSPSFDSVNSVPYWWAYLHKTLIPNLYSGDWYNGQELDWRERLQIDDRNTMRVGVGRIRQQRIKDDTCIVRKEFNTLIHHCRDHYSWTDDDTKDYLVGWEVPTSDTILHQGMEACYLDQIKGNNTNETSLHDEESPWVYRSSLELKNAPYAGTLGLYKGGGYTFTFKRTKEHTMRLLHELELHEWVDVNTRALFIEFTLYNANVNLFGSVIMLVEFMATGSATVKSEVKVFRLSSYIGGFGIVVIIFEVTFLFFVLYFMYNTCKLLKQQRLKFFKEFWSMLEFSMLILALISIVMYAMKKVFGTVAINALHESQSGDYVNFVTISIWDELFGFILAMVVFCATIKFIKMLKFNKRMGMLGDTIRLATKDLKNFSIVFFGFFFAFCMMAYVLFGKMSPNYGSFIGSVEALFAFALGDFDFYELMGIQPVAGPVFFFLYVAVIYIGMMGMFLTIIYDSFAEVKRNAEHQSNDYEIVDFILKRFKGVFGWS